MAENNKGISLDHNKGVIFTKEDKVLSINQELMIGDGANLPENPEKPLEEGLLKVIYNEDRDKMELHQTDKNGKWQLLGEPYDPSIEMIFAIIMGS